VVLVKSAWYLAVSRLTVGLTTSYQVFTGARQPLSYSPATQQAAQEPPRPFPQPAAGQKPSESKLSLGDADTEEADGEVRGSMTGIEESMQRRSSNLVAIRIKPCPVFNQSSNEQNLNRQNEGTHKGVRAVCKSPAVPPDPVMQRNCC
jgi:hypothetical protein